MRRLALLHGRVLSSLVACLGVGFSAGAVACAFLALRPVGPPRLVADQATVDLGATRQGASLTHRFTLRNPSAVPLGISRVLRGCDCTEVRLDRRVVEPGEAAALDVIWNVGGARHRTTRSIVVVQSPVAEFGELGIELNVRCDVEPDFEWTPPTVRFASEMLAEAEVRPQFRAGAELRLESASCTDAAFAAACDPAGQFVVVAYSGAPAIAANDTKLVIHTTSPHEPVVEVPILVEPTESTAEASDERGELAGQRGVERDSFLGGGR